MTRYLVVAIALWAGMGVAYGGRADFPSPTWSVRACPAGADAPKKYWNGISPQVKAWELGGRAETLRWFEENQFGRTPVGRLPDQVVGASSVSFTNAGIRIAITCRLPAGADAAHPAPVFLFGDHCGGDRPPAYEQKEYADIPTNAITARGYAYVRWNFNDVCPNASRWSKTLFRWPVGIVSHVATGDRAATNVVRAADGWGTIGAWAWGNSRVMDWIESRPELDATRVAVLGHSRGGKTALWTGAQDERFAMTISNGSGCGGARLGRARDPKAETIRQILHNFPNWFCPNFAAWIDRDAELPHDADDLMRLIAPRLVYVASGSEDAWAGPAAEKAAWDAAHGLYRAYGLEERMGYHCHEGPHKLRPDDWEKFMDFADRHLKAPSTADSDEIDRRLAAALAPDAPRTLVLARNPAAPDGVWRLTRAIRVPSDFTLVFDGCRVELAFGDDTLRGVQDAVYVVGDELGSLHHHEVLPGAAVLGVDECPVLEVVEADAVLFLAGFGQAHRFFGDAQGAQQFLRQAAYGGPVAFQILGKLHPGRVEGGAAEVLGRCGGFSAHVAALLLQALFGVVGHVELVAAVVAVAQAFVQIYGE